MRRLLTIFGIFLCIGIYAQDLQKIGRSINSRDRARINAMVDAVNTNRLAIAANILNVANNYDSILLVLENVDAIGDTLSMLRDSLNNYSVEFRTDSLVIGYKLIVPIYSSPPPNPVLGQVYYNTTDNDLWLWDGDWEILDGD